MSTRRELLISGAALAAAALAGCGQDSTPGPAEAVTVPKADVPVGGGLVFATAGIVVTQPEAGTFLGFSSLCTHQGCPVAEVNENGILCNCHGSLFSVSDGTPTTGPATASLPAVSLVDNGDSVSYVP